MYLKRTLYFLSFTLLGWVLLTASCTGNVKQTAVAAVVSEPFLPDSLDVRVPPPLVINYHSIAIDSIENKKALKEQYSEEELLSILSLNRIDYKFLKVGDTLIVPDTFVARINYTPFPHKLNLPYYMPKLIIVSYPLQAFAAYEDGRLVRWGPTSLGKKSTPTPTKLYFTNWKAKKTISTVNSSWILPWCFNIDNFGGVSFHEYELPGYPASHSCIRLLRDDAQWIYYWADQWITTPDGLRLKAEGTPVVVFGEYDYTAQAPWKKIHEDKARATHDVEELLPEILKYDHTIKAKWEQREQVMEERLQALGEDKE